MPGTVAHGLIKGVEPQSVILWTSHFISADNLLVASVEA
jgi:hypothetical protein